MKKQKSNCQLLSNEPSKYKFIPMTKLLKTKPQPMIVSKNQHFKSMCQPNDQHQFNQSHIQTNSKIRREEPGKQNMQKQIKIQNKLFRSISNPKLSTSNSRHSILTQKNPPLQMRKHEHLHFQKLTIFIQELQSKEAQKTYEIISLRQQNKSLSQKLEKVTSVLSSKNKQINDLNCKIAELEWEIKQKAREQGLIIDSLKKIIDSQAMKISQLKSKNMKNEKIKAKIDLIVSHRISQEMDEQNNCNNQLDKFQMNSSSSEQSSRNIESFFYDEAPKLKKDSMQYALKQDLSRDQNILQTLETSNSERQCLNGSFNKIQYPTPNFGGRTPKQSQTKLTHPQDDRLSSLECSLEQDARNLSLSRISQSVEEDFETSRQYAMAPKIQKSTNVKINTSSQSTHQQLLDQIDQYLSKRSNYPFRK